jgi:hypothetical protein
MIPTFLAAVLISSAAHAAMSDQIVRYNIRAKLDPGAHTITGAETLTWRNTSPDTIGELQFHLYLNAFQNEKSSFMRESGGHLRGDLAAKDSWGWCEVKRIRIAGGADLTSAIRYIHPDDNNADDRTVMAITLPQPVAPGASITLDIDWVDRMPKVFARSGYHDDFYMVGQWFPKIGVYEKAGDRYAKAGGWNCHQYHATTEFYADYGVYDVSITVPSTYVVGATGPRQSASEDPTNHTTTYVHHQEDVHDFSWTASPRFKRFERLFDPSTAVKPAEVAAAAKLLDLPESELALKPVRMILLIQPEHLSQTDRHFRATEAALKWFGLWYGAYPYDTITVVDPPYGAGGAAGMEYPTLITAGTSWWPGPNDGDPEEVIVHEFGHQYWYGMVGSNEFEESWLDEGFNTYSTGKIMDLVWGMRDVPVHHLGFPVGRLLGMPQFDSDIMNRSAYVHYGKYDPVVRNGWQYYDELRYGINSYFRPGALLRTLENYLGAQVMARVMRTWFERYKFHHPNSVAFQRVVSEVSGRNMQLFFKQFVFGTNALNYRVGSVENREIGVDLGSFLDQGKRTEVTEKDADRIEKERKNSKTPEQYRITVKLVREGESVFPVEMKMMLENGEVVREHWEGYDRWIKYEYTRASKAKSVELDPERKILLDSNLADNSWVAKPDRLPFAKWGSNLLFWMQMVLP